MLIHWKWEDRKGQIFQLHSNEKKSNYKFQKGTHLKMFTKLKNYLTGDFKMHRKFQLKFLLKRTLELCGFEKVIL